jgi:hypothetical protein
MLLSRARERDIICNIVAGSLTAAENRLEELSKVVCKEVGETGRIILLNRIRAARVR